MADVLEIETIENGPFRENCYVVADSSSRRGWLIDPGSEAERILARVRELRVQVEAIVNTHAHIDHIGAVEPIKRALGVPFMLHADEQPVLTLAPMAAKAFGLPPVEVPRVDQHLSTAKDLTLGQRQARVLLTPGHSPGGCCLYFATEGVIFVGDTIFAGSIGRTDLPGGDLQTLLASIDREILPLPDEVVAYCGHGPKTTIGHERAANPFLAGLASRARR